MCSLHLMEIRSTVLCSGEEAEKAIPAALSEMYQVLTEEMTKRILTKDDLEKMIGFLQQQAKKLDLDSQGQN